MDYSIMGFLISFFVTYVSIPVIIRIASLKKLVDVPDARKIHKTPIPSLGGFGIFSGFVIALLVSVPFKSAEGLQYIVAAAFIVYLLGLKDDVIIITPLKKLVGQLLAASILIFKADIRIVSLHGVFGIHQVPFAASIFLSYFAIILIINAFNLIDGVDGLAGTLGLISAMTFAIYFYFAHETLYAVMGLSLVGGLGAFLLFNYTPAKIFMGDTGSMLVGLVNAILLLHFIKVADAPSSVLPIASAPVIGLTILAVPLFDTLRVFTIRILLYRRSPFSPDRGHIHHLLLDCGFSHPGTTFTLSVYNLVLIVLAFAFRGLGNEFLLVGLIITGLSFSGMVAYLRQPRRTLIFIKNISIARPPAAEAALAESGPVHRKPSYQQKSVGAPMTMPPVFSLEEE